MTRFGRMAGLLALAMTVALAGVAPASGQPEGSPDGEIIGGRRADPGEYPFQVALLFHGVGHRSDSQFCAGTLVSPDTVLTAGHCLVGFRAREVDVLAGTNRLLPGGGRRVRARQLRVHPDYSGFPLANDIGIIQLGVQLPYELVTPAGPGQAGEYPPGTLATTIGWGDTDIRAGVQHFPFFLREVEVPVVSDAACAAAYGDELLADQMVCAGDLVDGGEDACQGDSGGPLLVPDGDRWLEIGVVSTGMGCARRRFPGIYTEVANYEGFVDRFLDPDTAPDRVTRLRQRPVDGGVRVRWRPPYFDGGTAITSYRVLVPGLDRGHTVPGTQTRFRLRHLPPGRHLVTVRAVNPVGASRPRSFYVHA